MEHAIYFFVSRNLALTASPPVCVKLLTILRIVLYENLDSNFLHVSMLSFEDAEELIVTSYFFVNSSAVF